MHTEAGGSSGSTASINDADIRALIGKSSGATMSFNEWYGASASLFSIAVVRGSTGGTTNSVRGNGFSRLVYGTAAGANTYTLPTTFGSTTNVRQLSGISVGWDSFSTTRRLTLSVGLLNATGTTNNAGFTTMNIGSSSYARTDANYVEIQSGSIRIWQWDIVTGVSSSAFNTYASSSSNPMGASDGTSVTFSMA
jgi:hypothetical protein